MNNLNTTVTSNKMKSGERSSEKVRKMALIGMLSAIATILMYVDFPLPFIAPPFYKLDFSELPVMIGAFTMGPLAGVAIELIKILVNLLLKGTQTAFVGEFANFLIGSAYILPASLIYQYKKTKKGAIIGLSVGTTFMAFIGCILNAFVLLPAYGKAFGMEVQAFVDMGSAIHSSITNVTTFIVLAVMPFNLLKGVLISVITVVIYKYISRLIKQS